MNAKMIYRIVRSILLLLVLGYFYYEFTIGRFKDLCVIEEDIKQDEIKGTV